MAFNPKIPAYSTQGKSFSRTAAFPLEGYEIWTDLEALKAYAANTDPAKDPSYIGQKVAYIDTANNRVVHYGIEIDGSLKELGADKMGVDALTAADHGKIPKAFYVVDSEAVGEEGTEDYQPEVGHVEIRWVTPEAFEDTNTVTAVAAADKSIDVTAIKNDVVNKDYEVKVNISAEEGNSLSLKEDGLYVEVPEVIHPEYAVRKEEKEGYHGVYHLTKDGADVAAPIEVPKAPEQTDYTVTVTTENLETDNLKHYIFSQLGKEIAHIDIPKDLVVESGTVEVKAESGVWGEAGTYIVLVIKNQDTPIYINVKDLVDIYTVADTNTVDMTITGTEIKADVKISAEAGNSLVAKDDGLYVNAPVLPTSTDEAVTNEYVTAVDQKDGKVTVSRKQISYNELADLPTIPGEADFGILTLTGEKAIEVTGEQDKVVKLLIDEANKGNVTLTQSENGLKAEVTLPTIPDIAIAATVDKVLPTENKPVTDKVIAALAAEGHTVTPTVLEVVTKAGWDKIVGENGVRILTQEEINKLNALNIEADGNVAISGTINAANVHGLGSEVIELVTGTGDYISTPAVGEEGDDNYVPAVIVQKLGIEKGAQVNKIEAIALPGAVLAIADKQVNIPYATKTAEGVRSSGVVIGSDEVNKIDFTDGVGEVNSLSTDKLVQGNMVLVLNGGDAQVTA